MITRADAIMRAGHTWIGVSAQRAGVDHRRGWSPARYGTLDVTGGGRFTADAWQQLAGTLSHGTS